MVSKKQKPACTQVEPIQGRKSPNTERGPHSNMQAKLHCRAQSLEAPQFRGRASSFAFV